MADPIVYVTRKIPDEGLAKLRAAGPLRIHEGALPPTREELLRGVAGAAGLLSLLSDRINEEVFEAAGPQLQVVSNFAVGFNNIDVEAARSRGIQVGNTPDVLTDATADLAIALLLAAARRLPSAQSDVKAGRWKTWEPMGWIGQDLKHKTLGIVGMGRIGQATARRLHFGWGMRVLYMSRQPKPDVDQALGAQHVPLDQLLGESDFVSVHVPLSDQTQNLFGAAEFAKMKSEAVFVNTARGEIVDQDALIRALNANEIFGAGLDVCTPEPLPDTHPLLRLENCIVLPHIGSATEHARNAMATRAADNILAGIAGQPLPYPVP